MVVVVVVCDAIFGMITLVLATKWFKKIEFNKDLKAYVGCNSFGISYQSALSRHQITCKLTKCYVKKMNLFK